jgi:hypothetical protein
MNEYLYRFKTKQEFIEEFGIDYECEDKIKCGWCYNMNRLFGTDFELITKSNIERFKQKKLTSYTITNDYRGWSISWDMIVLKNNNPTYLPKKLSYE